MHLANEESRITSAIISKFTWPGIVLALALAAVAGGCRGEAGVEDEAVRPVKPSWTPRPAVARSVIPGS
jgi:hypothetical protein